MSEQGWLMFAPDPILVTFEASEGPQAPCAVLVCPPFGWEEMTSYRALRAWARALAAAGFPTARIDLPGTGDSGGGPRSPERMEAWVSAVGAAAEWLADRTGTDRVTALGIGLGGLVATRVAAQAGSPIGDLMLWAVPGRGRTLMREMQAHAAIIAARHPRDAEPPAGSVATGPEPPGAELIGFRMSAETVESIRALDLTQLTFAPGERRRALLLGRDRLRVDDRLQTHLEQSGFAVTARPGEDYDALVAHPQEEQVPHATIQATVAWLGDDPPDPPAARRRPSGPAARTVAELATAGGRIRETIVELELPRGTAPAIVTTPLDRSREEVCAVLWPAGALRRIGPNRAWVEAARRWAARGVSTVRIDLPGIGDSSGGGAGIVTNAGLYDPARDAESAELLRQLGSLGLPERYVLGGLCSGAYWALHAALMDARVVGLLMINLYAFWWSPELVAEREPGEALTALRGGGWQRLARGDISPQRLRAALASVHPRRMRAGRRRSIESEHGPLMEQALDTLREQRTTALMLFSRGEQLLEQMARQGHLAQQPDRWPNLRVEELPTRDHMFRALWLQAHVHARLDAGLDWILQRSG